MADIRVRLQQAADEARSQAHAPGPHAALRRVRHRRRTQAAGGAALVVALAVGVVGLAPTRAPSGDPFRPAPGAAGRAVRCPDGSIACGESQGVRWHVSLDRWERHFTTPGGRTWPQADLTFWTGQHMVGGLWAVLPTADNMLGGARFGNPFDTPRGRLRLVYGVFTPSYVRGGDRIVRVRITYGDHNERPTGTAEAVTVPVEALKARMWAVAIPARAYLIRIERFDVQGNTVSKEGMGCAGGPPTPPLLPCRFPHPGSGIPGP
jgi:hypothetical protein